MVLRKHVWACLSAGAALAACGGGSGEAGLADTVQVKAAQATSPTGVVVTSTRGVAPSGALGTTAPTLPFASVPYPEKWLTVASSATVVPGGDGRPFNSFNQPSVNAAGLVVLRGRSTGSSGGGEPLRGIYLRDMAGTGPLSVAFDKSTAVPAPNNTLYQDSFATFTEFPAFPRIGIGNTSIATRGQSNPVWTYTLPDGTETRTGTSGVYTYQHGVRLTAASQLGAAPGMEMFSVPGAPPGTKFDQFPGAPAVAGPQTFVFKGNYTDGVSKTGIFFRSVRDGQTGAAVQVIASSDTLIPGQPDGGARFGSTAPPSAVADRVVFLGLDNEDAPTLGGIYYAPLATRPALQPLVSIGSAVPGETDPDAKFSRLGESLSFDGRFVAFWGAWGAEVRTVTLACPTDGQKDVIAYCNAAYPDGYTVDVPVHQGVFVHDLRNGSTLAVSKTGPDFQDYMYWTFSGRPPGAGDGDTEDFEPPRWRAASFAAAYADKTTSGQVAFKARRNGGSVDGIYLASLDKLGKSPVLTLVPVVETGMPGRLVDPSAPAGAVLTSLGIERDGLRKGWLALALGMLDPATSEAWAGVYVGRTLK